MYIASDGPAQQSIAAVSFDAQGPVFAPASSPGRAAIIAPVGVRLSNGVSGGSEPEWGGGSSPCCQGSRFDALEWIAAHPLLSAVIAAGLGFWIGSAVKR